MNSGRNRRKSVWHVSLCQMKSTKTKALLESKSTESEKPKSRSEKKSEGLFNVKDENNQIWSKTTNSSVATSLLRFSEFDFWKNKFLIIFSFYFFFFSLILSGFCFFFVLVKMNSQLTYLKKQENKRQVKSAWSPVVNDKFILSGETYKRG